MNLLGGGVTIAEIAAREGVTERGMRKYVHAIIARRATDTTNGFIATQVNRLNEALPAAFDGMSSGSLSAVDRVARIVRELGRYHGFAGSAHAGGRRPVSVPRRRALAAADREGEPNGAPSR